MKELRKLKTLAVIFVLLLVCLIGIVLYQYVLDRNVERELRAQGMTICELSDIRDFSICTSDGDTLTFHYDTAHQLISAAYNDDEYASDMLYESQIEAEISRLVAFSVRKTIEEPADISLYGLDADYSVISVTTSDGNTCRIRVGTLLPNKDGVYLQIDGQDDILIADYSYYQALQIKFETYLSMYIVMLDRTDVQKIDFDCTSKGYHWSMKPDKDYDNGIILERRYMVTEPLERKPTEQMIDLFENLLQLQASEYLSINESDYASYGLDQPEYHFAITKNDGTVIDLYFSVDLAGYLYGYCSNIPYAFRIQSQILSGIDLSPFDLCEAYVRQEYFDEVKSVRVQIKDEEFSMQFAIGNSQSIQSDDLKITLNQRNAKVFSSDGHCYGLVLFDSIFWIPICDMDIEANPDVSQVEATISVTKVDSEIYTIKLIPRDANTFYCLIDDRYTGYIVDRSVLYKDNGANLENYGIWDAYILANEAIDQQNSDKIYDRP